MALSLATQFKSEKESASVDPLFEQAFVSKDRTDTASSGTSPSTVTSEFRNFSRPRRLSRLSTGVTSVTAPTSISTHVINGKLAASMAVGSPKSAASGGCEVDTWLWQFLDEKDLDSDDWNEVPDRATLAAVQDIPLYDEQGESRTFGSLYDPSSSTHQRQLFVFIRHFYCGACQAYLKALTEGISIQAYFRIPIPTAIYVVGCGKPDLIPQYRKFTSDCPFPMYADPSRELFKKLGMRKTLRVGRQRPEYMRDISPLAWIHGQGKTIQKSLKDPEGIRRRDIFRGGHPMQIGGEFLFDQGEVIWCHRMKHYRDHAEVSVVRQLLDLDDHAL